MTLPVTSNRTLSGAESVSPSVRRVAHNSLWSLGAWIAASLLSFVATPILIRLLGRDNYGLMVLLTTILTPLGLLDFGIGEATIKYVAESVGRKDYLQTGKYVRSTLIFNLGVGILGGLVIVLLARVLATSVFKIPAESQDVARQCLYWIGIMWCLTQVRQTFVGVVVALQRYRIMSTGSILSQVVTLLAGLGVLFLGGNLLDLVRVQTIAAALAGFGWLIAAQKLLPGIKFIPSFDRESFRKTFGFGFWQMLNNLGGILAHESERWLLAVMLPVVTVGFYNIGFQLVTVIYLVTYKVGLVLFPAVSDMQGQGKDEQAARLVVQANWVLTSLAISGFVPLVVFAHDFLLLWVGPDFASHTTGLLRILALGTSISCLFAIPNFYLLGTGRSKWLAVLSFIQGIITLVVAALLIPKLGLAGAGWGMTASTAAHITFLIVMWKRIFRVWIPARVYFSSIFGQLVTGIILAVCLLLLRNIISWSPNWMSLSAAGMTCAAFSFATIIIVDSLLPGGAERRRMFWQFSAAITPGLFRLKKRFLPVTP